MPPKKQKEEQPIEQPTIPLSALPPEAAILSDNMPYRLYVHGYKQGDVFVVERAELDRR